MEDKKLKSTLEYVTTALQITMNHLKELQARSIVTNEILMELYQERFHKPIDEIRSYFDQKISESLTEVELEPLRKLHDRLKADREKLEELDRASVELPWVPKKG